MNDSRLIRPGDRVVIIGLGGSCWHCLTEIGRMLQVVNVAEGLLYCDLCQREHESRHATFDDESWGWPIAGLRRLPPLGELEGLWDRADIPAPKPVLACIETRIWSVK